MIFRSRSCRDEILYQILQQNIQILFLQMNNRNKPLYLTQKRHHVFKELRILQLEYSAYHRIRIVIQLTIRIDSKPIQTSQLLLSHSLLHFYFPLNSMILQKNKICVVHVQNPELRKKPAFLLPLTSTSDQEIPSNHSGKSIKQNKWETSEKKNRKIEDRVIRTPNLLIWNQTRYRCAMPSCLFALQLTT